MVDVMVDVIVDKSIYYALSVVIEINKTYKRGIDYNLIKKKGY